MTSRREILGMAALCVAAPRAVAQAARRVWRVAFLSNSSRPPDLKLDRIYGLVSGMEELGYREGRNLTIDWRFADDDAKRLDEVAAQIVASRPDAIVTIGSSTTAAVRKATRTIPIVMGTSADPVGAGLVESLARPGGNVTGLSNVASELGSKHLELMSALAAPLSRVAVLANPRMITHRDMLARLAVEARSKGIAVVPANATGSEDLATAFELFARERAQALLILIAPLFTEQRDRIAGLALERKLPSIAEIWQYADAGGLVAYGANLRENFRRAAFYVDRIFKGARPADLPVEQPTTYELVINRRTARALNIVIPRDVELRADRIVD